MKKYYQVSGWLSPDGQHFSCNAYGHLPLSKHIVKIKGLDKICDKGLSSEYILENLGWMKISIFHRIQTEIEKATSDQIIWIMKNFEFFRPDSFNENFSSILRAGFICKETYFSLKKSLLPMDEWIKKWNL